MIQVNLLPKVKLEYIKAIRNKRLTILVSFIAASAALAILTILFIVVSVIQKKHSSDLTKDIQTELQELQGIPELEKVLTVQNQLSSLSALHSEKPITSRAFGYIESLTPNEVSINGFEINYAESTISITGEAESLVKINEYVDTLKFTNYSLESSPEEQPAFTEVVLKSFSKSEEKATYEITAKFDPIIFSDNDVVKLVVPKNKITTRSETEKPKDLFKETTIPEEDR